MEKIKSLINFVLKNKFYIIFFLIWFIFNTIVILQHEHWRDEGQAWMIAKVLNFSNFRHILSYEGHGVLWYLVTKPFILMKLPYDYYSFISLALMSASVILLFKTKLSAITKILLTFSPIFCYFNPVLSRSYCLCILELTAFLYFYHKGMKNPILIGILAFLMLQTHIYMAAFAIMCSLWLLYKYLKEENYNKSYLYGAIIGFLGCLFLYYTLGESHSNNLSLSKLLKYSVLLLDKHFIAIFAPVFNNTVKVVTIILYRLLELSFIILIVKKIKMCVWRIIFALGSISGIYVINAIYKIGHYQHIILFLAIVLLCAYLVQDKTTNPPDSLSKSNKIWLKTLNISLLIILLLSDITSVVYSKIYNHKTYSNSKATAQYILKNLSNEKIFIPCDNDKFPNIVAYLGDKNNLLRINNNNPEFNNQPYTYYDRYTENKKASCSNTIQYTNEQLESQNLYFMYLQPVVHPILEPVFFGDEDNLAHEYFYIYKLRNN